MIGPPLNERYTHLDTVAQSQLMLKASCMPPSASDDLLLLCSVQGIVLAGGPSENALARFRAMPAVKLGG